MNRMAKTVISCVIATCVVLAPTAASARSGDNFVVAINEDDDTAKVEASVVYRVANKNVDEDNRAYALNRCIGCQTLAVAFQLVLITKPPKAETPHNEAFAANVECEGCVVWASAKQILVKTGGPATVSAAGQARLAALEDSLEALEAEMPAMTLGELQAAADAAFGEFLDIAQTEVVRTDGGANDAQVTTRSA